MTLAVNSDFDSIEIVSTKLNSFISSPSSYTKVEVIGEISCSGTTTTKTYTSTSLITGSTDVRTSGGNETIVPNFFGLTSFGNGVYSFTVRLTPLSGAATSEKACLFVNQDLSCKMTCVEDMMYLYTLENSQSCSCNCTDLCTIYNKIIENIGSTNNCNC